MAIELRFKSLLAGDKYAYTFHADSMHFWDAAYRTSILWTRAGWYETFGDGMTQHSIEGPVPPDRFEDYCASLATYLLQARLEPEELQWLSAHHVLQPVDEHDVAFALDIRHRVGKRQWFSLKDQGRKLSCSESKKHDKRYREVPEWADGSVRSGFELLRTAEDRVTDTVALYALYDAVHHYDSTWRGNWGVPAAQYLKLPGKDPTQAFRALRCVLESIRQREAARHTLECWQHHAAAAAETTPAAA